MSSAPLLPSLTGPIPAVHTPLDASGALRTEVVASHAAHLRRAGVAGVYACGSTGESLALTAGERKGVLEAWIAAFAGVGGGAVIAHVGANALPEARDLARHAAAAGAHAISAMHPTFGRARTLEAIVAHHARIAEMAPSTPYIVYELAGTGAPVFPASALVAEAARTIPTFAGVKYTSGDLLELQLALEIAAAKGHRIFFGTDEHLLAGLALGCTAAIGSTYSYAPSLGRAVFEAFAAGDLARAREEQRRLARLVRPLLRHGVLRTGKFLLETAGVAIGPPRSPETALDEGERAAVLAELAPLGVAEFAGAFAR
jgi:N-acetylneuraminate lyase